jgi:2,5-diamino-6-(ribosylamino)-4(3H)-pyrimidinone 5'-phosphate reductase
VPRIRTSAYGAWVNERDDVGRPYVVFHAAVSLDSATTGFAVDVGRYYQVASTWREDVTLTGADTILAQSEPLSAAPRPGPAPEGPLLAVVDSRSRVSMWEALRDVGHWRGVTALHAESSPPRRPVAGISDLVVGIERVALPEALRALQREHGARVVRVDSGGALAGALLGSSLVDEVSLLLHPTLVGQRATRRWHGDAAAAQLELISTEHLDGLVWLRYRVLESASLP